MNEPHADKGALELIKKLLRLNRSSNPNEAALALQKAQEIAAKHRIDISAVNPAEDERINRMSHQNYPIPSRVSYERDQALVVVINYFHVQAVVCPGGSGNSKVVFIGTKFDIEIAHCVYEFLVQHMGYCWKKHKGRLRNRRSFIYGMRCGICSKLKELAPTAQTAGLVLSRKAYKDQLFPATVSRNPEDPSVKCPAANAGWIEGWNTNIRKTVSGAAHLQLGFKEEAA